MLCADKEGKRKKSFVELSNEKREKKMKWLEVIELRSVGSNQELLESHLQMLIDEVEKEASKQTIKSYRRVMIDTDFSIHLVHDSTEGENSASPLGLRLTSALKEFGMVNHRIWVEMPRQMPRGHKGVKNNENENL